MTDAAVLDRVGWNAHLRIDKFKQSDLDLASVEGLAVATLGDLRAAGIDPYAVVEVENANVIAQVGVTAMLSLLTMSAAVTPTSLSLVPYSLATTRICVGDGWNGSATTVPTVSGDPTADTDLYCQTVGGGGASHRYNQLNQGAGTPAGVAVATNVLTVISVFASANANFAWNEWCVDSGTTSGTGTSSGMLNHKGVYLGTKTSAAAWTATATFTVT